MPIRFRLLFPLSLVIAASTLAARADTITQQFTTGSYSGMGGSVAFDGTGFDSMLGTLNSISVSYSGNYSIAFPPGPGTYSLDDFTFGLRSSGGRIVDATFNDYAGSHELAGSGTDTIAADLRSVSTNAPVVFLFDIETSDEAKLTTSGLDITVNYNYTPPVAPPPAVTPEPSSIALLGTGLLSVAGLVRRRFRS